MPTSAESTKNESLQLKCSGQDPQTASILSYGFLLDGEEISLNYNIRHFSGKVFLSFDIPIEYNGWFFVTSKSNPPSRDPVRFSLHALDGSNWRVVGSSSYVRIHTTTIFFHTPYSTSTARGRREIFDLYRLRVGSMWQSILTNVFLALADALKREDLGKYIL